LCEKNLRERGISRGVEGVEEEGGKEAGAGEGGTAIWCNVTPRGQGLGHPFVLEVVTVLVHHQQQQ